MIARLRHRAERRPARIREKQKARFLTEPGLFLVDLISLCSKNYATGVGTADMRRIKAPTRPEMKAGRDASPYTALQTKDRRKWTRLSREQREEIITRYRAGEPSTVLTVAFNVAKVTITNMLRDNNVVIRRQPLSADQVVQAVGRYASGESLARIGSALAVSPRDDPARSYRKGPGATTSTGPLSHTSETVNLLTSYRRMPAGQPIKSRAGKGQHHDFNARHFELRIAVY